MAATANKLQDHPPLYAVRQSSTHGRGVFAVEIILAGTYVMDLTGRRVHRRDLPMDFDGLVMQVEEDEFLLSDGSADDYLNHSCDPNMAFTEDGNGFYALRNIGPGEELRFHYSTCEDDPEWRVECHCGAPSCIGYFAGFPAMPKDEQKRLLPLARPYLRRKYGAL